MSGEGTLLHTYTFPEAERKPTVRKGGLIFSYCEYSTKKKLATDSMSEQAPSPSSPTSACSVEMDLAFLTSFRGLLKLAEMVTVFVAFVCYASASPPIYVAATVLELLVTLALLLLYLLKLNKRLTLLFWPLVDVLNSVVAAGFMLVVSVIALSTYTVTGTLAGGIVGFISAVLWSVDGFMLGKRITLNQPRSQVQ